MFVMRFAAFILALAIALSGATIPARAATLFNDGPATTDFSVFPGWQRVMAATHSDIIAAPVSLTTMSPAATGQTPEANLALKTNQAPKANQVQSSPQAPSHALAPPQVNCLGTQDCVIKRWKAFISATAKLPRDQQLDAVNRWANAHAYVEDWANWGLPDYWETPREFLTRGGDCEDFAIIKYFTLKQLGFSPDDMRIMVVNDTNLEIFHAILAVRQKKGEPVLLDNQAKELVPMSAAPQYHLIYSLNERGWWMANSPAIVISSNNISSEFQTASGWAQ